MKKLFIVAVAILLSACTTKKLMLGMSEQEFLKNYGSAKMVSMSPEMTIYRITKTAFTTDPGTRFYYFHAGKLFLVDQGQQRPDLTIDQTIHHQ